MEGAHSTSSLAGRLIVLFIPIPTLCSPGHGRTDVAASFKSRPISETRIALRRRVLALGGTLSRPWPWGRVDPRFGRNVSVGLSWPRRFAAPRANSTLGLPQTPHNLVGSLWSQNTQLRPQKTIMHLPTACSRHAMHALKSVNSPQLFNRPDAIVCPLFPDKSDHCR